MDPNFWGNPTWKSIHSMSFNYPENPTDYDKQKYFNFFNNLGDMLPCPSCATSYKLYMKYIPINEYLDDIYGITFWLYTIHFLVNKKLAKKNINFIDVIKMYYPHKTNCAIVLNTSDKCTAPSIPSKKNQSNVYINFLQTAERKYNDKTKIFVKHLLDNHPSLT